MEEVYERFWRWAEALQAAQPQNRTTDRRYSLLPSVLTEAMLAGTDGAAPVPPSPLPAAVGELLAALSEAQRLFSLLDGKAAGSPAAGQRENPSLSPLADGIGAGTKRRAAVWEQFSFSVFSPEKPQRELRSAAQELAAPEARAAVFPAVTGDGGTGERRRSPGERTGSFGAALDVTAAPSGAGLGELAPSVFRREAAGAEVSVSAAPWGWDRAVFAVPVSQREQAADAALSFAAPRARLAAMRDTGKRQREAREGLAAFFAQPDDPPASAGAAARFLPKMHLRPDGGGFFSVRDLTDRAALFSPPAERTLAGLHVLPLLEQEQLRLQEMALAGEQRQQQSLTEQAKIDHLLLSEAMVGPQRAAPVIHLTVHSTANLSSESDEEAYLDRLVQTIVTTLSAGEA